MAKPSLSHHPTTLKAVGLVEATRSGQDIIYSLNTTALQDLMHWFYTFTNKDGPHDE